MAYLPCSGLQSAPSPHCLPRTHPPSNKQGSQADFKNELLFNQFGINYAHLPEQFKKVCAEEAHCRLSPPPTAQGSAGSWHAGPHHAGRG